MTERTVDSFLSELAARMWRGHHWRKQPTGPRMVKAPLTDADLARHGAGGVPVGLCPIAPGTSTTRVALIDLDSHSGTVPWEKMITIAQRLKRSARLTYSMHAIPFRSSGGHGIHLLFTWDTDQDARSVRAALREVLRLNEMEDRAGPGVEKKAAEVFPKQDSVPADGYGSMFILPYGGESLAIDTQNDWRLIPEYPVPALAPSADVPWVAPALPSVGSEIPIMGLDEITAALYRIDPHDLDYDDWRNLVFAVHSGTGGSEDGLRLVLQWSAQYAEKHDERFVTEEVWPHIRDRENGITIATLFAKSRENYTPEELAADFTDVRGAADAETQDPPPVVSAGAAPLAISWESVRAIDAAPPPPVDWVVEGWLAAGTVTTLFAQGGFGKSLIAQQLLTSVANNRDWLGMSVSAGCAMGFFSEEDSNELLRRQQRIFHAYGLESDSGGKHLFISARVGMSNTLVTFDHSKSMLGSKFLRAIEAEVERIKPRLLVLDNTAQMFGGDENDRHHVTSFLNLLSGIAIRHSLAVLVLGHTAKADVSEFSGSTAWSNAGRSRLFLRREEDGTSTLSIAKTNLGVPSVITVYFNEGVFDRYVRTPENEAASLAGAHDVLIRALNDYNEQGRKMRHEPGTGYLVSEIIKDKRDEGISKALLVRALGDLIQRKVILLNQYLRRNKQRREDEYGLKVTDNQELIPKSLIGNDSADLF